MALLTIALKHKIPEAMKPRRIEIAEAANDQGLLPKLKEKAKVA